MNRRAVVALIGVLLLALTWALLFERSPKQSLSPSEHSQNEVPLELPQVQTGETAPADEVGFPAAEAESVATNRQSDGNLADVVSRQLLVQFTPATDEATIQSIALAIGAEVVADFTGGPGLRLLRLPKEMSAQRAREYLSERQEVVASEPDQVYRIQVTPNDPDFDSYWGLQNTGQSFGKPGVDIGVASAWARTTGSKNVYIGIIDTGIDFNHIDLVDNVWINPGEIPGNGLDDDGDGWVDDVYGTDATRSTSSATVGGAPAALATDPYDDNGHGTHVAGTIAARGNNGIGGSGVMWDANLIACKAFDRGGGAALSAILECIYYFVALKDAGVDIVATNNSWGGGAFSQMLRNAIEQHQSRGILFVAAAGNVAIDLDREPWWGYPASYDLDNIVSVTALDRFGLMAGFGNYGATTVDLAAPGADILSTLPGDTWAFASGTSMAAPHVTGAIGLLKSKDPALTAAELKAQILATAVPEVRMQNLVLTGGRLFVDVPIRDRDQDGMDDDWELASGLDPLDSNDGVLDPDADGLTNLEEYNAGADPNSADTDGDGLSDGDEVNVYTSNPSLSDSDGDSLSDLDEVMIYGTDPSLADTDGDGLDDDIELALASTTDPFNPDTDGDGASDGWEAGFGFDPADPADGSMDSDSDGLTNAQEFAAGSSPYSQDSDGDGLDDFDEVNLYASNPANADSDFDGMSDAWEVQFGLNVNDAADSKIDVDLDGYSNGAEFRRGTDPLVAGSAPVLPAWDSFAGTSSNASLIPIDTRTDDFSLRWVYEYASGVAKGKLTTSGGLIYSHENDANFDDTVTARAMRDGSLQWRTRIDDVIGWGPPSLLNGSVYSIAGFPAGPYSLNVVDGLTGSVTLNRPLQGKWFSTVTQVSGDRIFVLGRDTNDIRTIYSFDASTGNVVWQTPLGFDFRSQRTFAVNDQFVADYSADTLSVLDRGTGAVVFESAESICYAGGDARLVFDDLGYLYVSTGNCVAKFDLQLQVLLWDRVVGSYPNAISVDESFVFVNMSGSVAALDAGSGKDVWRWWAPSWVDSGHVTTLNHVFISDETTTYALNRMTGVPEWIIDLAGELLVTDDGALLIAASHSLAAIDLLGDSDKDGAPDWWERRSSLNPADPADGIFDADADGLSNSAEFLARTNPRVADTDADGLSDDAELAQYGTDPTVADTDHDMLTDGDEVNAYGSDPLVLDTDGDSYTDGEEVGQFLTVATDRLSVPSVVTSVHESFENGVPPSWITPGAASLWQASTSDAIDGNSSLYAMSPSIGNAEVEWSAIFDAGDLTFSARTGACCDRLRVYIDNVEVLLAQNSQWANYLLHVTKGSHTIRWAPDSSSEAWLDDVRFGVPRPLGSSARHVIVDAGAALNEFALDGKRVRGRIRIPATSQLKETTLLPNHNLAAIDRDALHVYDAITDTVRTIALPKWVSRSGPGFSGIVATGDSIVVSRITDVGGLFRFDLNGNLLEMALIGSRYSDLTMSSDGSILALREDVHGGTIPLRDNAGLVDRIDPGSLSIDGTLALELGSGNAIEESPDGSLFVADDTCYRCKFTVRKYDAAGTLLSTLQPERDISAEPKGAVTDIAYIGGGDLAMISLTGEIIRTDVDFSAFEMFSALVDVNDVVGQSIANIPKQGIDTDLDGLPDWWERANRFDYLSSVDATLDPDRDGLNNLEEFAADTDPLDADTDADGLDDGFEVHATGSNPLDADTDSDGLSDSFEVGTSSTSPLLADTDLDGLSDDVEVSVYGTDPLATDSDLDGLEDGWEIENGLDPLNAADAAYDADNDGLSNDQELALGTDPQLSDSDHDGLTDLDEVATYNSDPLRRDTDGDRVWDSWEVLNGFDPLSPSDADGDADGDGFNNRTEYFAGSDPYDAREIPVAMPWSTHQGNPSHTGLVPIHTAPMGFTPYWLADVLPLDSIDLHPASSAGGRVWVTTQISSNVARLIALDALTGTIDWQFDAGLYGGNGPPSLVDGLVFLNSGGPAHLWGFDQESDALVTEGPTALNGLWDVLGPTPYGKVLYLGLGPGGIGAYSAETSQEIWIAKLGDSYGRTPAVDDSSVYVYEGARSAAQWGGSPGKLVRFYSDSGIRRGSIPDPGFHSQSTEERPPALGRQAEVLVVQDGRLVMFDLLDQSVSWEITSNIEQSPVLAEGIVYVAADRDLVALEAQDGNELWRWTAPAKISNDPIATLDHVFVATATSVHAIDRATGTEAWNYPRGGALSLGNDRILYVGGTDGNLQAIALFPDTDLDGVSDTWEAAYGLSNLDPNDAAADLDSDGLSNIEEFRWETNAADPDSDGDSISDADEVKVYGTQPRRADSDGDSIGDAEEIYTFASSPTISDTDGDGLADGDETWLFGTDPTVADSDGDAVTDPDEILLGSDPLDAAALPAAIGTILESFETGRLPSQWENGAGATTGWEVLSGTGSDGSYYLQSMPVANFETAAIEWTDYFLDGEIRFDLTVSMGSLDQLNFYIDDVLYQPYGQTYNWRSFTAPVAEGAHTLRWEYTIDDPNNPADRWIRIDKVVALTADGDGDLLPDDWELAYGLDPRDPADAGLDTDADGLTNDREFAAGTLPNDSDSDDDGIADGWEVEFALDPLDPADAGLDPDMDGKTNLEEFTAGTDPRVSNASTPPPSPPPGNVGGGGGAGGGGGGGGGSLDPFTSMLALLSAAAMWRRRRAQGTGSPLRRPDAIELVSMQSRGE